MVSLKQCVGLLDLKCNQWEHYLHCAGQFQFLGTVGAVTCVMQWVIVTVLLEQLRVQWVIM